MKLFIPITCSIAIALLVSAFIHSTDSDINGIQGLASATVLLSVFAWSLLPFAIMGLVLLIVHKVGFRMGFLVILLASAGLSLLIVTFGSTAETFSGKLIGHFILTGMLSVMMGIGTILPYRLIVMRHKTNDF